VPADCVERFLVFNAEFLARELGGQEPVQEDRSYEAEWIGVDAAWFQLGDDIDRIDQAGEVVAQGGQSDGVFIELRKLGVPDFQREIPCADEMVDKVG
jgi:hypothetical protein